VNLHSRLYVHCEPACLSLGAILAQGNQRVEDKALNEGGLDCSLDAMLSSP
jgi:hypothetical protein